MSLILFVVGLSLLADEYSDATRIQMASATTIQNRRFSTLTGRGHWGGGAVFGQNSDVWIRHCIFDQCENGWVGPPNQVCPENCLGGGAIFVRDRLLDCADCQFLTCRAYSGRGGAICCLYGSQAKVTDCDFSVCGTDGWACDLSGGGGAIVCDGLLEISLCTFDQCSAPGSNQRQYFGGCVLSLHGLLCSDCKFRSCGTENNKGGAIHARGTEITIRNSEFSGCTGYTAWDIYCEADSITVTDLMFSGGLKRGNAEERPAGLILQKNSSEGSFVFDNITITPEETSTASLVRFLYAEGVEPDVIINELIIHGNGKEFVGPCVDIPEDYGKVEITDSSFDNFGRNAAGGVFLFPQRTDQQSVLTFTNTIFKRINSNAEQNGHGGALYFAPGNRDAVTISGCEFDDCEAKTGHGGALYFKYEATQNAGSESVKNCTFINCRSVKYGQSLHLEFSGDSWSPEHFARYSITNCTFSHHTNGDYVVFLGCIDSNHIPYKLTLSDMYFMDNQLGGAEGMVGLWSSAEMEYDNCQFLRNTNPNAIVSVFRKESGTLPACHFRNCLFDTCTTTTGSIIHAAGTVTSFTLVGCDFISCASSGTDSISCILPSSATIVSLEVSDVMVWDCSCAGASFSFSGTAGSTWTFTECEFATKTAQSVGRAISFTTPENFNGVATINIIDCCFKSCVASDHGGAIWSKDFNQVTATIQGCQFTGCKSDSSKYGGAIYCKYQHGQGSGALTVTNCTFTSCISSNYGQSLHLEFAENWELDDHGRYSITNCTFSQHATGNYVIFLGCADGHVPFDFTFSDMYFTDNTLPGENGIIGVWSSTGITYDNCHFLRNNNAAGTVVVFRKENAALPFCRFEACVFDECTPRSEGFIRVPTTSRVTDFSMHDCEVSRCSGDGSSFLGLNVATRFRLDEFRFDNSDASQENAISSVISLLESTPEKIELIHATFSGVRTSKSLLSHGTTEGLSQALMNISWCTFTQCETSGPLLDMTCGSLELSETTFTSNSGPTHLLIHVSSGESHVTGSQFGLKSGDQTMIDLTCDSGAQIDFYNCCFVHDDGIESPKYMSINTAGAVSFSSVCFSKVDSSAVTVTGEGQVSYEGNKPAYFGDCECWIEFVDSSEPEEPSQSPEVDPPESPEVPPSDSPSDSEQEGFTSATEQTDPGWGGGAGDTPNNAGLIAGVIVGVLVIIAIIVVVVILLLRRKKDKSDSEDDDTNNTEFTEETVATTVTFPSVDGQREWSQTTEESPLFTETIQDGESPFTDSFEEDMLDG